MTEELQKKVKFADEVQELDERENTSNSSDIISSVEESNEIDLNNFSSSSFSPPGVLHGVAKPSNASFSCLEEIINGEDENLYNPEDLSYSRSKKTNSKRISLQSSLRKVIESPITALKEELQNIDLNFSPLFGDTQDQFSNFDKRTMRIQSSNPDQKKYVGFKAASYGFVKPQAPRAAFDKDMKILKYKSFSAPEKRRKRSFHSVLTTFVIVVITILSQLVCFQSSFFGVLFGKWTENAERFDSILSPSRGYYKFKLFSVKKWKMFLMRLNMWQYIALGIHAIQLCGLFLFSVSFLIAHFLSRQEVYRSQFSTTAYEWFYGFFSQNVYFVSNILMIKIFEILFLWSSMFWENSIQIFVGYFMSSICLLVQVVLYYLVQRQSNDPYKEWMAFCILMTAIISLIINIPIALKMAFSYGRRMFKIVGVSRQNKLLFVNDQYIISILVGDIQFLMTSLLLVIFCFNFPWWVYFIISAYSYISIAMVPVFISVFYLLEYRIPSMLFCIYQSLMPGFLLYLVIGLLTTRSLNLKPLFEANHKEVIAWEMSHVTIVAGLAILWRLLSIGWCLFSIAFLYGHKRRKLSYRHLFEKMQEEVN